MGLVTKKLCKQFGEPPVKVLFDIDLEIKNGDFVSIAGKSGSGKSTLMYLISTLDTPSSGEIIIDDRVVSQMTHNEVHEFRNFNVGFVFQFHYLLPELSAIENVLMPTFKNKQTKQREPKAKALLERFGLADKFHRRPHQLSGGEQQRVAIARSLIMDPKYIFADEPTGNLDTSNSEIVFKIFQEINREQGTTFVYVTHDPDYANIAKTKIVMVDGRLTTD